MEPQLALQIARAQASPLAAQSMSHEHTRNSTCAQGHNRKKTRRVQHAASMIASVSARLAATDASSCAAAPALSAVGDAACASAAAAVACAASTPSGTASGSVSSGASSTPAQASRVSCVGQASVKGV